MNTSGRPSAFKLNTQEDLFMAARTGNESWLRQIMVKNRTYLNASNEKGLASFHVAALECQSDLLKIYLNEFNIDANLPTSNGWTALHLCISNKKTKQSYNCMKNLVLAGADVNSSTHTGLLPLHLAGTVGHLKGIKFLLDNGASVDGMDDRGQTPYSLAMVWGQREAARILAHHVWIKMKIDEIKQKQAFERYCKKLQAKHEEVMKLQEKEKELKAQESFKQWHEKNGIGFNPLLFGVTNSEPEQRSVCTERKREQEKTEKVMKKPKSAHPTKTSMIKEKQDPKPSTFDDKKIKFIPLSTHFKL